LVLLTILCLTNEALSSYFSWREILLGISITLTLVMVMLRRRNVAFALLLIVPQAIAFGTVNPVSRGLTPITSSALYRFFRSHPQALDHKWIFFTNGTMTPGFLIAAGCNEYTGYRFLPDLDHFSLFASRGMNIQAINMSAILLASALNPNTKTYVTTPGSDIVRWYVSPSDPILKQLGIEYFAFDGKPAAPIASQLIPLSPVPLDNIWLYRLR
jgi:hypothetical protein